MPLLILFALPIAVGFAAGRPMARVRAVHDRVAGFAAVAVVALVAQYMGFLTLYLWTTGTALLSPMALGVMLYTVVWFAIPAVIVLPATAVGYVLGLAAGDRALRPRR